jgi:hypothetical protein
VKRIRQELPYLKSPLDDAKPEMRRQGSEKAPLRLSYLGATADFRHDNLDVSQQKLA